MYICSVLVLLALIFAAGIWLNPKNRRVHQHLSYNTQIEDTSLSVNARDFSSRLPVVRIETGGQTIPGKPVKGQRVSEVENSFIQGSMEIAEKEGVLHTFKSQADVEGQIKIRVRGNTSRWFDKTGYLFKFINKNGMEQKKEVMGMEGNSTWILHGPYLDKSLMRNYMWHNLSGEIMEWAPDTRFCEVFIDGVYKGLYVMMEQISIGEGRVNVSKYDGRSQTTSYIVCADRESINDVEYLENFLSYARKISGKLEIKYPGSKSLTPELTEYISRDFSEFEKALYSYDYDSKRFGYQSHIDTGNFVDYCIINEVTQNGDAGYFSTYFYKDVSGKLKMAVWDFNNCCDNYMDEQYSMEGFDMSVRPWFYMLMKDENFTEKIINRYRELREGVLSNEYLENYIQEVQEYLGTAVDRNFQVWGDSFLPENDLLKGEGRNIASYEDALEQYRRRLVSRLGWMDKHIESIRSYSHESVNKKFNH